MPPFLESDEHGGTLPIPAGYKRVAKLSLGSLYRKRHTMISYKQTFGV